MVESKQSIVTEPIDKINFSTDDPKVCFLRITNQSETKLAFKVKCTRNDLFRIKPATGILDYNQMVTIGLSYKGGPDLIPRERHHFGVYHIPAPEGCTSEGAWAEHYGPPQGDHKLKVVWNE